MLPDGFQQTLFAKFLSRTVQSFRNTIGVKQDGVAWSQFAFFQCAIPFLEQAHYRAGCPKPFQTVIPAQEQRRRMAAIRIAQLARVIVVFRSEERRVGKECVSRWWPR